MPIATKFSNVIVSTGDRIRLRTPGGGGYGNPFEREPERVLRDVIDGYVSIDRRPGVTMGWPSSPTSRPVSCRIDSRRPTACVRQSPEDA